MSAEFLQTAAAALRASARDLAAVDGRLDDANAGVVGWLHREADELEAIAVGYVQAVARATAHAEPGLTALVVSYRSSIAEAPSLAALTKLHAEARTASREGLLPDVIAEQLQAAFRDRAAEIADEATHAQRAAEQLERRRGRMFALLGELDMSDASAYRPYMAETLMRPVETSKSLTAEETERVIARLEAAAAQQDPLFSP